MYIISQDSYFIKGMDKLLADINPQATHSLVAFDRGDGQILFFSLDSLLIILREDNGFLEFICNRYLKVQKSASVKLLKNEIERVLKILKDNDRIHVFRKIHLSVVEGKVLLKLLDLQSSLYVAESLNMDRKIVSNYKNAILRKLGLNNLAELIHIYNNWNDCFCCTAGKVMPDAVFIPCEGSNELRMVRRSDSSLKPSVLPPFTGGPRGTTAAADMHHYVS